MSVDYLRNAVRNINVWIMVLDTKGVNVWCAAGKGTFGTDEIIKRINIQSCKDSISQKNNNTSAWCSRYKSGKDKKGERFFCYLQSGQSKRYTAVHKKIVVM